MATLDELFAEVGLTPPQRTNRNRTVTTPGSYEAPVEGIQDYGAFQRGFTAGITPGLVEKKKQDIRVDKAAKEFDALKLNELIETSDTDPIEFKKNAALRGQTLSLLKGELRADYLKAAKNNDTQSMNDILGQLNNLSEGIGNFNTFLTESQKTDQYDMEASNYRIGNYTYTDKEGKEQPLTFNQLADVNNTNPKALSYVQKKDEYGAVDTFLTVKNSKYGSFEVNISDLNAAQIQNKLALKADYGIEATSHIKENPIVEQITTGSIGPNNTSSYTTTQVINGKDVKVTVTGRKITDKIDGLNRENARAFALKSMGEDDFNELMPSFLNGALKRTDMFSSKEQKDNYKAMLTALQTEQGMKNYAETNGLSLDEAKQSVKDNVNSIIEKSLENEYLKRTGSYEWDSEKREYVPAILDAKRSVSEAPVEEVVGDDKVSQVKGRLFNITSNINDSVYNVITPSANPENKTYLKVDGYKDINVKELTGGYFADIDGTKATLTSGRVVRDGNNMFLEIKYDVGRSTAGGGDKVVDSMTEQFPIARIGKDESGKEKAFTDFAGRKRFAERIYKAQFGSSTADTATDLLTGDSTVYKDRTKVQSVFGSSGKDETMFRRLDIINKYNNMDENDPMAFYKVRETMTDEDHDDLMDPANKSDLAVKYRNFINR